MFKNDADRLGKEMVGKSMEELMLLRQAVEKELELRALPTMLFLLTREDKADYDENAGFVIEARDEEQARALARDSAANEGAGVWDRVTCVELKPSGVPQIILTDFRAG